MGASLSTAGHAGDEGVTVVSHGPARRASAAGDEELLRQLADLRHSLPLIPDLSEPGSIWAKALLQRGPPAGSAGASSSSAAAAATGLPRLDGEPLEQLVLDYQRFSRWHCRRIVEKQEQLNAAIPRVEQQALRVQHHLSDAVRAAAAEQAAAAAVADARREVEAVAGRLARLQQSLRELEEEVAAARQGGGQGS